MMRLDKLIGVDWGSTHLRIYLLDSEANILRSVQTKQGVNFIDQNFASVLWHLLKQIGPIADEWPILLGGMIGSNRGWLEMPYVDCPINRQTLSQHIQIVSVNNFNNPLYFIPGIRCQTNQDCFDLMRGEETQVFGALMQQNKQASLFCLPGTHSKWVLTKMDQIHEFYTFLTGELFQLFHKQYHFDHGFSKNFTKSINQQAFYFGLAQSQQGFGLLHDLFQVRVQNIIGKINADSHFDFLSGLLIGSEIKAALAIYPNFNRIHLIANDPLAQYYRTAFSYFDKNYLLIDSQIAMTKGLATLAKTMMSTANQKESRV